MNNVFRYRLNKQVSGFLLLTCRHNNLYHTQDRGKSSSKGLMTSLLKNVEIELFKPINLKILVLGEFENGCGST